MASTLPQFEDVSRVKKRTRHSYDGSNELRFTTDGDISTVNADYEIQKDNSFPYGGAKTAGIVTPPISVIDNALVELSHGLMPLYSETVAAKIWGVASRSLRDKVPPRLYPEYTEANGTAYVYSDYEFWTSGFFPGSLYLLLERQRKYPMYLLPSQLHPLQLQFACKWWSENLHNLASKRDTHDLGFLIQPWARKAWELDRDQKALDTLVTAAISLASRFNGKVGSLRSWDTCVTKVYDFQDPSKDFLVIIDNMLNLDLLFWVSAQIFDQSLATIATAHARTTQSHHIRPDKSTFHVVNFEQSDGSVKAKFTNQGHSDDSCWSRGQAWGILGFMQTYLWTRDTSFMNTAKELADYFLQHLPEDGVPYFDFLAPSKVPQETPRDSSAAIIACYGMLLLHEGKLDLGEESPYLGGALHILRSVLAMSMAPEAKFVICGNGELEVEMGVGEETILRNATINNFEFAPRRWADHGLVYADYYLLVVGNKLLDMGLAEDNV